MTLYVLPAHDRQPLSSKQNAQKLFRSRLESLIKPVPPLMIRARRCFPHRVRKRDVKGSVVYG